MKKIAKNTFPERKKVPAILTFLSLFILLLINICCICFAAETSDVIVSVNGANGTVNEYLQNDRHYLFLPQDISLSGLKIDCNTAIAATSKGEISEDQLSVTGDFYNSDEIELTAAEGDPITVVLLQSKLPSVCIHLNGITQEEINAGSKDVKYPGNDVYITNADGSINAKTDAGNQIEIKGRGNSTWKYAKRPYQIKFDSKTKVLGMYKAKKWLLLAADDDATLLRDKTAFAIARGMNLPGTPEMKKVDLWIDGNYQGNYSVCQKIDTNSSSLNLSDEGILVELDNIYYKAEEHVFTSSKKNHYVLKVYNCDDGTEEINYFNQFCEKINAFETALYASKKDWNTIKALINEESWARCYLLQEFTENYDAMVTSTYFFMDNPSAEINLGPVWDMGLSLGNSVNQNVKGDYLITGTSRKQRATYFTELMKIKEFRTLVKSVYATELKSAMANAQLELAGDTAEIAESANMNYQVRWPDKLGQANVNVCGQPYKSTYQKNIDVLSSWMTKRLPLMGPFDGGTLPAGQIKLDCTSFKYDGTVKTPNVIAAGLKAGYDYKVTYPSGRVKSGTYKVVVKGLNRYSGSIELPFKIKSNNPVTTSIKELRGWKKCITVRWKKLSKTDLKKVTGYQIQYSRNKDFSGAAKKTVKSKTQTYLKITKLAKNRRYYVQVRTYRKKGSTYYYSYWSKVKYVKTK